MESMERLQYINSKHEYYLTTKTPPDNQPGGIFDKPITKGETNKPTHPTKHTILYPYFCKSIQGILTLNYSTINYYRFPPSEYRYASPM